MLSQRLSAYAQLIRLDKPIGSLLLLWPTLWGLWLAGDGRPHAHIVVIFIVGVFLMRSAGCIINDIADRNLDAHVERTQNRPLAAKKIKLIEAIILLGLFLLSALTMTLFLNLLTIILAIVGALLAACYPLMKRFTHWPQLVLGAAFSWGIPMAFAAQTGHVAMKAWLVFFVAMIWPIIYDTFYAMADRQDDIKIGIKSTAILFAENDRLYLFLLQILFINLLAIIGVVFHLNHWFYSSLLIVSGFSLYQQNLIKNRQPKQCFQAFINSNWCGFFVFLGIVLSYLQ